MDLGWAPPKSGRKHIPPNEEKENHRLKSAWLGDTTMLYSSLEDKNIKFAKLLAVFLQLRSHVSHEVTDPK